MIVYRAGAILPIIGPPLRNAWVAIEDSRIRACGTGEPPALANEAVSPFPGEPFAILPSLVNAHTHIELSHLAAAVPPSDRFDQWIRTLVAMRRKDQSPPDTIEQAARAAIGQARASGTGLMGDVANTLITPPLLAEAGMAAYVFHELIGFNAGGHDGKVCQARADLEALGDLGGDVRVSLAPHAPYSVAPELFEAIRRDIEANGGLSTVHLAESRDEIAFLQGGGGVIRAALEEFGAWNPEWTAPGCGPVEYLARLRWLNARLLIVHAVQLTDAELQQVKLAGATLVTCPRSNRWTGVGSPPVARFYASGVAVAIGTDSLASVDDLNVFSELSVMRRLAPQVPARLLLESATRTGAQALGAGGDFGTIEPGKRASLIAVRIPGVAVDVEEYLLTGIRQTDIRWLSLSGR